MSDLVNVLNAEPSGEVFLDKGAILSSSMSSVFQKYLVLKDNSVVPTDITIKLERAIWEIEKNRSFLSRLGQKVNITPDTLILSNGIIDYTLSLIHKKMRGSKRVLSELLIDYDEQLIELKKFINTKQTGEPISGPIYSDLAKLIYHFDEAYNIRHESKSTNSSSSIQLVATALYSSLVGDKPVIVLSPNNILLERIALTHFRLVRFKERNSNKPGISEFYNTPPKLVPNVRNVYFDKPLTAVDLYKQGKSFSVRYDPNSLRKSNPDALKWGYGVCRKHHLNYLNDQIEHLFNSTNDQRKLTHR